MMSGLEAGWLAVRLAGWLAGWLVQYKCHACISYPPTIAIASDASML
jgi:hypothetical protein